MAEQENFKPIGYNPVGWTLRKIFVDDEGNVFRRGAYCPDEKNSMKFTSRQLDGERGKQVATEREKDFSVDEQVPASPVTPEGMLPPELIERLTSTMMEEFRVDKEKAIQEFKDSLKKSVSDAEISGGIKPEELGKAIALGEKYAKGGVFYRNVQDLDPDDYDPIGAIFTCYGVGYLIIDDVRQGLPVTTPYGRKFVFKFQASRITKIGKAESYSAFCTFSTNSKIEIKWLRDHTLYNIEFYEDSKLALEADAQLIPIAAKIYRQVSTLDQPDILKRAEARGIKLGGDLRDIMQQLAVVMAKDELAKFMSDEKVRNVASLEQKIFG